MLANQGNVTAEGVVVSGQVVPQAGGATASTSRTVSLAAATTQAVALPPLKVVPGRTYNLSVAITPPTAQADRSGISETFTVHIAASPPPTTTTAPTTTTTAPRSPKAPPTTKAPPSAKAPAAAAGAAPG